MKERDQQPGRGPEPTVQDDARCRPRRSPRPDSSTAIRRAGPHRRRSPRLLIVAPLTAPQGGVQAFVEIALTGAARRTRRGAAKGVCDRSSAGGKFPVQGRFRARKARGNLGAPLRPCQGRMLPPPRSAASCPENRGNRRVRRRREKRPRAASGGLAQMFGLLQVDPTPAWTRPARSSSRRRAGAPEPWSSGGWVTSRKRVVLVSDKLLQERAEPVQHWRRPAARRPRPARRSAPDW